MQDAKWLVAIPSAQPWRFNNFLRNFSTTALFAGNMCRRCVVLHILHKPFSCKDFFNSETTDEPLSERAISFG